MKNKINKDNLFDARPLGFGLVGFFKLDQRSLIKNLKYNKINLKNI